MQSATVEVNLTPAQAADFRDAQPVPVRNQDHGIVAMAIVGSLAGSLLENSEGPLIAQSREREKGRHAR
jgi:hypothetical protein